MSNLVKSGNQPYTYSQAYSHTAGKGCCLKGHSESGTMDPFNLHVDLQLMLSILNEDKLKDEHGHGVLDCIILNGVSDMLYRESVAVLVSSI